MAPSISWLLALCRIRNQFMTLYFYRLNMYIVYTLFYLPHCGEFCGGSEAHIIIMTALSIVAVCTIYIPKMVICNISRVYILNLLCIHSPFWLVVIWWLIPSSKSYSLLKIPTHITFPATGVCVSIATHNRHYMVYFHWYWKENINILMCCECNEVLFLRKFLTSFR